MTTTPVMSITDEQLAEIQKEFNRNAPCPHYSTEPIGFGHFHRCHDCGRDVPSDMLDSARHESLKHDSLSALLGSALSRLRAAEKDAERYRWLRDKSSMPGVLSSDSNAAKYFNEYMLCGEQMDKVIDAAMEQSK